MPFVRLMGNSVFCLVPRGRAAWSVRFFEALWAGCVPVLLSDPGLRVGGMSGAGHRPRMHHCRQDHYQPSFDQLFDTREMLGTHCGVGDGKLFPLARFVLGGWWAELNAVRFVIKWPVSRIDESLVSFLTDLPLDVARRYIENGRSVRCLLADLTRALQMSSGIPVHCDSELSWSRAGRVDIFEFGNDLKQQNYLTTKFQEKETSEAPETDVTDVYRILWFVSASWPRLVSLPTTRGILDR